MTRPGVKQRRTVVVEDVGRVQDALRVLRDVARRLPEGGAARPPAAAAAVQHPHRVPRTCVNKNNDRCRYAPPQPLHRTTSRSKDLAILGSVLEDLTFRGSGGLVPVRQDLTAERVSVQVVRHRAQEVSLGRTHRVVLVQWRHLGKSCYSSQEHDRCVTRQPENRKATRRETRMKPSKGHHSVH